MVPKLSNFLKPKKGNKTSCRRWDANNKKKVGKLDQGKKQISH